MRHVQVKSVDQWCEEFVGTSKTMYVDNWFVSSVLFLVVNSLPIYLSEAVPCDGFWKRLPDSSHLAQAQQKHAGLVHPLY